ncbi:MAG: phage tail length tape measure family protein [Burkholderiaceae bacterium]
MSLELRGINYALTADTQSGVVGINAATEALKRADAAADRTRVAFLNFGKQGEITARQMQALSYQITDIVSGLASGQSPFLVLLQQGGQLRDQFGGLDNVFKAVANSLTVTRVAAIGSVAGLVGLAAAWAHGREENQKFAESVALTGNAAGITKAQFDAMAKTIAADSGHTIGAAKTALQELASSGQFSAGAMAEMGLAALQMQRLTGESIGDITKRFIASGASVTRWAAEGNKAYSYLTAAQFEHIRALEAGGSKQEAAIENFRLLGETLKSRSTPAVDDFTRALREMHGWGAKAFDWIAQGLEPQTLEQKLKDLNSRMESTLRSGKYNALAREQFKAYAEQQFAASKEVFRNIDRVSSGSEAAAKAKQETEDTTRAAVDTKARISQAGADKYLAQQRAALDAEAFQIERAYTLFQASRADYTNGLNRIDRARLAGEEANVRAQIELEQRRAAAAENPEQQRASAAAQIQLETKLVEVKAKRAALEREIAAHLRNVPKDRAEYEDPRTAFRRAELEQQRAADPTFSARNYAAQQAIDDLIEGNRKLSAELITEERDRGQALIAIDVDQQRKRLLARDANAEQSKVIEAGLAEYTLLREKQLTEQLKPEWQKRREQMFGDTPKAIKANFDQAMVNLEQSAASAWSTLLRGGKGAGRQFVDAFNDELARIGWNRYLAKPFQDLMDKVLTWLGAAAGGNLTETGPGDFGGSLSTWAFHSGGIAGVGGTARRVGALAFAGAPRYHVGGLASDEVPAILRRGEEVIARSDARHRLNGGRQGVQIGAIHFNVPAGISPAAYAAAVQPSLIALERKIINDLSRPGHAAYQAARL